MKMYDYLGANGYLGYPEPAYGILCVIANTCGLGFSSFQVLISFMSLTIMAAAIRRVSPNYALSILLLMSLYFVFYAMNIFREMTACFILVYAYFILSDPTRKKRKMKFLLILLFAIGFHKSTVFLVTVLFIDKINLRKKLIIMGLVISFVLGIIDILSHLGSLMGWYQSYLDVEEYVRVGNKFYLAILLSFYWMIGFLYLYKCSDKNFRNSIYLKLFFVGIVLSNIFLRQDLGLRLLFLFTISLIIGLPLYIQTQCKNKLLNQAVIIGYTSLYGLVFSIMDSADVIPYIINN